MIEVIIKIVKANLITWNNNIEVIFVILLNISSNERINSININANIIIIRYVKIFSFIFNKIFNIFNLYFIISIINKISIINEIRNTNKISNINYKL